MSGAKPFGHLYVAIFSNGTVKAVLRLANAKAPAAGAVAGMPPGISALMCVISSLRDTAHFSDEEGELTDELRTLRDWAMTLAAAPTPAAQADSVPAPVQDGEY